MRNNNFIEDLLESTIDSIEMSEQLLYYNQRDERVEHDHSNRERPDVERRLIYATEQINELEKQLIEKDQLSKEYRLRTLHLKEENMNQHREIKRLSAKLEILETKEEENGFNLQILKEKDSELYEKTITIGNLAQQNKILFQLKKKLQRQIQTKEFQFKNQLNLVKLDLIEEFQNQNQNFQKTIRDQFREQHQELIEQYQKDQQELMKRQQMKRKELHWHYQKEISFEKKLTKANLSKKSKQFREKINKEKDQFSQVKKQSQNQNISLKIHLDNQRNQKIMREKQIKDLENKNLQLNKLYHQQKLNNKFDQTNFQEIQRQMSKANAEKEALQRKYEDLLFQSNYEIDHLKHEIATLRQQERFRLEDQERQNLNESRLQSNVSNNSQSSINLNPLGSQNQTQVHSSSSFNPSNQISITSYFNKQNSMMSQHQTNNNQGRGRSNANLKKPSSTKMHQKLKE